MRDIVGGAGTYSALGARLLSPPPRSRSVGWIVDKGSDFPPALEELIASWQTSVLLRPTPERLTTRGWNGYDQHQNRAFRYTTPKKRLTAEDLTPSLLAARSFHLICSPQRCRSLVSEIKARRHGLTGPDGEPLGLPRPVFVWEPVPDLCTPDELLNCTNVLPLVDICSPNHTELAGFMGDPDRGLDPDTGEISTRAIERACEQLLGSMPLQSFALVVRAGEKGCYLARNGGRKRKVAGSSSSSGAGGGAANNNNPPRRPKKPSALLHGGLQPDTDMFALFAGLLQDPETGAVAREEIEVDPGVERWIPAYHQPRPYDDDDEEEDGESVGAGANGEEGERLVNNVHTDADIDVNAGAAAAAEAEAETGAGNSNDNDNETDPDPDVEDGGAVLIDSASKPNTDTADDPHATTTTTTTKRSGKRRNRVVVDPTGGGNAFLGALATALARGKGLEEAAAWASVAASLAIEQVGVPVLTSTSTATAGENEGRGGGGARETWNGVSIEDRFEEFKTRLAFS